MANGISSQAGPPFTTLGSQGFLGNAVVWLAAVESQPLQVLGNGGVKAGAFSLLFVQLHHEPLHLVFERLTVVGLRRGADVAVGGEHVAVAADFGQRGAFAEAGDVGVGRFPAITPPLRGEGIGIKVNGIRSKPES